MKHPFQNQTNRQIRWGLIASTVIFLFWLALTYYDHHRLDWFDWMMRGWLTLLFIYCWVESWREMKRRKKP